MPRARTVASYLIGIFGAFQVLGPLAVLLIGSPGQFGGFWISLAFGAVLVVSAILLRRSWGGAFPLTSVALLAWYGHYAWTVLSSGSSDSSLANLVVWASFVTVGIALSWRANIAEHGPG